MRYVATRIIFNGLARCVEKQTRGLEESNELQCMIEQKVDSQS